MEYYVYISKSKIDMMYDQIIKKISELNVKGGLNIGIFSVESEKKKETSIYEKINVVIKLIEDYIGDIYNDADYIRGKLAMRWKDTELNGKSNAIYWNGESYDNDNILNKIILIGSQHHMIGNSKLSDYYSTSALPAFLNDIENKLYSSSEKNKKQILQSKQEIENDKSKINKMDKNNISNSDIAMITSSIYLPDLIDKLSDWNDGIYQEYEFVARFIQSEMKINDEGDMIRYVVASPLYVIQSAPINKRVVIEKERKKYVITKAEYEQHKKVDFKSIHLLLKKSGLEDEGNKLFNELQCLYKTYNIEQNISIKNNIDKKIKMF